MEGLGLGVSGIARMESALYKRILPMEKKLDGWIEAAWSKDEEDKQDREFQRDLKARVCNLEEEEKRLIEENEELKDKLAKYEK